jgi:hypothetical protein
MLPRTLSVCALVLSASFAAGQETKDPFRFVPKEAELVVQVRRPRELLGEVERNELFQQAQKLVGIRDYYDSTNFHRLYQLIAYFEKQLGKNRDELLDDLSAGGVVISVKVTPPKGALIVFQGKDEKALRRLVAAAQELAQQELDRQESKDRLKHSKYLGHDLVQLGAQVNFAIAEGAFLFASDAGILKSVLEARQKNDRGDIRQVASFAQARQAAPENALAWGWLQLEQMRKIPEFKNGLDAAALDPFQMLLFGGMVDQLRRTPYVSAALTRDGAGYKLGVFMPCGRAGMSPVKHIMVPAGDGVGTLPPLMPPRTVASSSYFLDLREYWEKRRDILGVKNAKGLEDADAAITKFSGINLGKLLHAAGAHQRFVVAQQKEYPYKIKPVLPYASYALVVATRDPDFAKHMNSILRSAALVSTFKFGLMLKEESYKGCDMISYHFSETKKVPDDPSGIRFMFTPTYVSVGDQFVMSTTAELARDLIDVLKSEPKQQPGRATMRTEVLGSGLAEVVRANGDTLLTQLMLAQALSPKSARQELQTAVAWLEQLGSLRLAMDYGTNDFHFDVIWQPKTLQRDR